MLKRSNVQNLKRRNVEKLTGCYSPLRTRSDRPKVLEVARGSAFVSDGWHVGIIASIVHVHESAFGSDGRNARKAPPRLVFPILASTAGLDFPVLGFESCTFGVQCLVSSFACFFSMSRFRGLEAHSNSRGVCPTSISSVLKEGKASVVAR